jgi:ADP-ribose pyrophosphatase YjhB (NUDIX family)
MRRALLEIADELRSLAQTGLHYAAGPFDRERYEKILKLAARLASAADERDPEELERLYRAADEGYVTPKLDVRMAVFRGDSVLLVRERADRRWSLPGGFVDIGDSPSEAAVRETFEEAGVEVRAHRLAGIFDRRLSSEAPPSLFHIHKVVFTGQLVDPDADPRSGFETLDARFFPLDALPELSPGRTLELHVREALRVSRDPTALPHFD